MNPTLADVQQGDPTAATNGHQASWRRVKLVQVPGLPWRIVAPTRPVLLAPGDRLTGAGDMTILALGIRGRRGWQIMAGGWARDGDVQDQIDASVDDAVRRARSQLPQGEGLSHCEECGAEIPEARRRAIAGVRSCVACKTETDRQQTICSGYNRRGSKDSQLR